jgi:hypothetical protein
MKQIFADHWNQFSPSPVDDVETQSFHLHLRRLDPADEQADRSADQREEHLDEDFISQRIRVGHIELVYSNIERIGKKCA